MAVTLAISGFHHGLFEILQGNQPTTGFFIASIGPDHVRWEYGTDGAVTLLPNFLLTGVAAVTVSLAIIVWSAVGLQASHGPTTLLVLFVLLTLVGGGIGHILFFVTVWAYATRIRRDLAWWRRRLGPRTLAVLPRTWLIALAASSLLFLVALELSVFGYPPLQAEPDRLLSVIWLVLGSSFLLLHLAYAGAIAQDVWLTPPPGTVPG